MTQRPTVQALRRTIAITIVALCLLLSPFAMAAFPRSPQDTDYLLAGVAGGLALYVGRWRWSSLGILLAGSLVTAGALGLHGWPVIGLWICAGGLWYLWGTRAAGPPPTGPGPARPSRSV